jgi:hypothetical protein
MRVSAVLPLPTSRSAFQPVTLLSTALSCSTTCVSAGTALKPDIEVSELQPDTISTDKAVSRGKHTAPSKLVSGTLSSCRELRAGRV